MVVIGSGNTGMKLAQMFDKNAILLSTAEQDTNNYIAGKNITVFSRYGAAKRFKIGSEIWAKNYDSLQRALSGVSAETVMLFSSFGGGSGSSSLLPISKILIDNGCKILIVGALPFKKENNPALSNAVQSINSLLPIIDKVSVMIFDNDKLIKKFDGRWDIINNHIIKTTDYIVNLVSKFSLDLYSPITIDQSELESVVFGGGFIDFSSSFIEEGLPRFEYGAMDKLTKNCLMAMVVDSSIKQETVVDTYMNRLTEVIRKYSGRVANARLVSGILRASINMTNSSDPSIKDRCYFTIASGLSIDKYIKKLEKIKNSAISKAEAFAEKVRSEKILDSKESKVLDV